MKTPLPARLLSLGAALLVTLTAAPGAADETEIFTGVQNAVASARPNILFIIDTSGSMGPPGGGGSPLIVSRDPYNPAITYTNQGSCSTGRIYYTTSGTPTCSSSYVTGSYNSTSKLYESDSGQFRCKAVLDQINASGRTLNTVRAAQFNSSSSSRTWRTLFNNSTSGHLVDCEVDAGVHGATDASTSLWARNSVSSGYTNTSSNAISWSDSNSRNYVFYSGNYLNYLACTSSQCGYASRSRLQVVQAAATSLIDDLAATSTVNAGLMRYSHNTTNLCQETSSQGGMVLVPVGDIATNANTLKTAINNLTASGCTPMAEVMYEAYLYMSGGAVDFGLNSRSNPTTPFPSVPGSRDGNQYRSPIVSSCERNFIVFLTDGLPTADRAADTKIVNLPGFGATVGTGCVDSASGLTWSGKNAGDGRCLDEISQYIYTNDLRPDLPGTQNAITYTIGFGDSVAAGTAQLREMANKGGGAYYEAAGADELTEALTKVVRNILAINTTFTAPAVSVNAFNRTQNLNELYVSVFRPATSYAWPGNIKKYALSADGTILDADGNPAVENSTGFFRTTARSFWTTGTDGDDVRLGGAANQLPSPADRKVYSNISSNNLSATGNRILVSNDAVTGAMLGLVGADAPGRDALIDWLRGTDIDAGTTEALLEMGDPMHGRPATVIYGGASSDEPDPNDGVIFAVTNQGFLHAIDVNDGRELWAYMPRELLGRARDLYRNEPVGSRSWGLDANVRVHKHDVNGNGIVESGDGDRVLLFFGMRRGGSDYYGLDVTDRNNPVLLWKIGPGEAGSKALPEGGQSWSTPAVTRVNVAGATQNALKLVLIFGGGYDTVQDNGPYVTDTVGNRIFMVDALSGNLLWYAGDPDSDADLQLDSMTHSIPADVRVVDLSGNGFADRMYAADMGGRVWRFDIFNGNEADALVTGGVFASLGTADLSPVQPANNRRFYNAPDVSFPSCSKGKWLNIALGSGYRGHPLALGTNDRFYSLRDYRPFARLTQDQYDDLEPITEQSTLEDGEPALLDVTSELNPTLPPGAAGWRFDLRQSGAWTGEKSLSEARTFQDMIQFATYEPNSASTASSTSCTPALGTNRLYTVKACDGSPVYDSESPADPPDSVEDRSTQLAQGGIAPEVVWLFPSPDSSECEGAECRPSPICLVGVERCGVGADLAPVRTFWRQTGVN